MAGPDPLTLTVQQGGGNVTIFSVAGEVDLDSSGTMEVALKELIDDGHSRLVLDFANLSFIDSTGLSALVVVRQRALSESGVLCLAAVQPSVRRALSLTGVDQVVDIYESVADAVDILRDDDADREDGRTRSNSS